MVFKGTLHPQRQDIILNNPAAVEMLPSPQFSRLDVFTRAVQRIKRCSCCKQIRGGAVCFLCHHAEGNVHLRSEEKLMRAGCKQSGRPSC